MIALSFCPSPTVAFPCWPAAASVPTSPSSHAGGTGAFGQLNGTPKSYAQRPRSCSPPGCQRLSLRPMGIPAAASPMRPQTRARWRCTCSTLLADTNPLRATVAPSPEAPCLLIRARRGSSNGLLSRPAATCCIMSSLWWRPGGMVQAGRERRLPFGGRGSRLGVETAVPTRSWACDVNVRHATRLRLNSGSVLEPLSARPCRHQYPSGRHQNDLAVSNFPCVEGGLNAVA